MIGVTCEDRVTSWVWTESTSTETTESWLEDWEMGFPALRDGGCVLFPFSCAPASVEAHGCSTLREEGEPSALMGGNEVPRRAEKTCVIFPLPLLLQLAPEHQHTQRELGALWVMKAVWQEAWKGSQGARKYLEIAEREEPPH